jgi:tol-pal system protein YbgF
MTMNTSGRLLVASILAVALIAPPAYPQNRNEKQILTDLERDLLDLKSAFGDMRDNTTAKNAEMKELLQQILGRFTTIDASVQKLETSLSAIKASDEASARALQQANTGITEIKKSLDTFNSLGETLAGINRQMTGLKESVNDLKNKDVDLPSAKEAFNAAWATLQQGHYDLAIGEFREFLTRYPNDPVLAPSAQVHIGDAYLAQGKFEQAEIEFDTTIQKWPESDKKCSALYKKGLTLAQRKPQKSREAAVAFSQVGKECPTSTEAPLALAEFRKLSAAARQGL